MREHRQSVLGATTAVGAGALSEHRLQKLETRRGVEPSERKPRSRPDRAMRLRQTMRQTMRLSLNISVSVSVSVSTRRDVVSESMSTGGAWS